MILNEPIVLTYGALYVLSLVLAVGRRKDFPLGDALVVALIIGLGFTGLVYLIAPPLATPSLQANVKPSELIFVLIYLVLMALLLTRGVPPWFPTTWKEHFIKRKTFTVVYKLLMFVFIPLTILRLFWAVEWAELGFSLGDLMGQIRSTALLIFLLGGFNLLVGGGATPIRARQFSGKQLAEGFVFAFIWNIVEVGLVEEFFFRAFLQTRLINYLNSPLSGICAASLLFGLAHAPGIYLRSAGKTGPLGEHPSLLDSVLYTILVLSPTGWFMGLLFWRTQSLLAPILVHAGVDTVAHMAEFITGLGLAKQED